MVLLVSGTISQRYIGLYQSQNLFLGNYIFWLGSVPLPGAYFTLGLIGVSLVVKLVLKSPWKKSRLGVIIAHSSILVLLVGALVTDLFRQEGYMILGPGDTESTVYDYHARELAILKNGKWLLSVPQSQLRQGNIISHPSLPFSLRINAYYPNSVLSPLTTSVSLAHGPAKNFSLNFAPLNSEDADNNSGAVFEVSGTLSQQDGVYIASEYLAEPSVILEKSDHYEIILRHEQRELPFSVHLIRFEKSDYPGTDMARSYKSQITVKEGTLAWDTSIEMNQPLRHLGYTFYQSSFLEKDGKQYTVLAVVKNIGALFPYIAIASLCTGLLLHLVGMLLTKARQ